MLLQGYDDLFDGFATASLFEGGVAMYDGEQWHTFETDEMGIDAPMITQIYETSSGELWFVVKSTLREKSTLHVEGLLLFKEGEWTSYQGDDFPCLGCKSIDGLQEDPSGRIWFWSDGGIFYYENGVFARLSKDERHKPNGKVTAAYIDSRNNLWLGSGGKVGKYDGNSWTTYTKKEGLPPQLYSPLNFVEMPDGSMVLIAQNGIYHNTGNQSWQAHKFGSVTFNGNKEKWQHSYGLNSEGHLWVAHRKNLVKFDGMELIHEKKNLSDNLMVDAQDRVWAPTGKGLEIYDHGQWGLNKDIDNVFGYLNSNGAVWVLTKRAGAWKFKNNTWDHYSKENTLPSNRVNMGYVSDDGSVWISTSKGMCRFLEE